MSSDDWRWMVIALALPAVLCALRLNLDLWGDEVYTLVHFASQPVTGIVTDYSLPNNHILFTLLLRPLYLYSSDTYALRLLPLVLSLGTLALTYRLAWRLISRPAAVWATLALGLNVMFLVHTMQLRGYGLSMLLTVALANVAAVHAPAPRARRMQSAAIVLLGAALVYTIPTNALFLLPLLLWNLWGLSTAGVSRADLARRVLMWAAALALGLVLYAPVFAQLRGHSSPSSWQSVVQITRETLVAANHDWWPFWLALPLALYCCWRGSRVEYRSARWSVPLLVLLMLVVPFVACAVLRMAPFPRNFCPMLPFLALGIAWSFEQLFEAAKRGVPRLVPSIALLTGAALVVAVLLPAVLLYPARLERVRSERFAQDGYYNYYAARFEPSCVAQLLARQVDPDETYVICWADRDHYDLAFAFSRAGFPIPPRYVEPDAPHGPLYVVVSATPDYEGLAQSCGISREELESFSTVGECGYFRVLRSPTPRVLAPSGR